MSTGLLDSQLNYYIIYLTVNVIPELYLKDHTTFTQSAILCITLCKYRSLISYYYPLINICYVIVINSLDRRDLYNTLCQTNYHLQTGSSMSSCLLTFTSTIPLKCFSFLQRIASLSHLHDTNTDTKWSYHSLTIILSPLIILLIPRDDQKGAALCDIFVSMYH